MQKQDIFWYGRYKFYRNKISKLISKSKQNHLRKFFQDNVQNFRGTWKKINELPNTKPNKNDDIVILGEPNNKFQDYLKDPNTHRFFLKETTPAGVQKLLNNLNTRKASDIYGISPKLVKLSSEQIKKCLSQIFIASFHNNIVPDKLKSAVIYPIH